MLQGNGTVRQCRFSAFSYTHRMQGAVSSRIEEAQSLTDDLGGVLPLLSLGSFLSVVPPSLPALSV